LNLKPTEIIHYYTDFYSSPSSYPFFIGSFSLERFKAVSDVIKIIYHLKSFKFYYDEFRAPHPNCHVLGIDSISLLFEFRCFSLLQFINTGDFKIPTHMIAVSFESFLLV
jgi:hypothetical protein